MKMIRILFFAFVILIFVCSVPFFVVSNPTGKIYSDTSQVDQYNVAIVFGAGLANQHTPSDVLDDRLKVAADLYSAGKIKKILVSGDNNSVDYSEPDVMQQTLINDYNVSEEDIYIDYAGRRTYDTCIRANKIWGIEKAILVSQDFHLQRAIWTCSKMGIESDGISASLRSYLQESSFRSREVLAKYKAFIDVYLFRPSYIGGEFIADLDN